jgi:hypothetical protein
VSSLMLWAWLALAAAPSPQTPVVSGTVVDPDGKLVKGATVWLTAFVDNDVDVENLAQVETDADGRFTVDASAGGGDRPRFLSLWAHAPGSRVAVASLSDRTKDDRGPVQLTLGPPATTPVRVRGADGKPVAGATVRLSSRIFPAGLGANLEVTTDAQGRATIEGVNPGQVRRVDVTAARVGTQGHNVAQDQAEKTVQLFAVGWVAVRIATDNPTARAGWMVVASSFPDEASNPRRETNSARGRTDESGRVALGPLAAGQVAIRVKRPDWLPYLPDAKMPVQATLHGGETREVAIGVKKAIKVEGSVQEHGTGKPAARVKVNLSVLSPGFRSEDLVTDDLGQFSLHVLPCKLRVSLTWFALPDRYFHAPDAHWADYELAAEEETRRLAPLEVWPAVAIKGTVVDQAGKPVEGVQVSGSCRARIFGDRTIPGSTQSDEHGAFVLGRMAPDSSVEVWGQLLDRAEAQRMTVRLDADGVPDAPVTLRLVKKPTVALRGRVLGPGGVPLAGAQVNITYRTGNEQNAYGNSKGEDIRTGPDGTYRTKDDVPRADMYRAFVMAPGMDPVHSDWAKAPAVELPDVTLRRASRLRSVAGRVVDADGKGVAGAEVFQSGDGPKRTSDTTDDDGRFTIPEVIDAPGFVFVRKSGYRFTGRRIGPGDEPVEVVVSKVDGPAPPPLKPTNSPLSRAEERAKARALIAPVWESFHPGETERPGPFAKAPTLALVDTPRMVERIEDQVIQPDGPMLANVALGLFEDNSREAAATLDALRPPATAAQALLDLFDQVPDAPADVRHDLLNRALTRAREAGEPTRRVALTAKIADRWFEAGEPEKGRPLVDEARAAFKELSSGASLDVRGDLADALARVDLPEALDLLGPGKNEERLAGIDRRAAADDPAGVERILVEAEPDLPGQGKNEERLAGVARRAAANDPAGAERIFTRLTQQRAKLSVLANLCAGMAVSDVSRARALPLRGGAPGVAALTAAVAARIKLADDPDGAKTLLAEAYDRLEPLTAQMVVPSVSMARLLPLAVRIDPQRSSEYLWRAIAARPPRALGAAVGSPTSQIRRNYRNVAQLAALVARYDRDAALTIFAPVADNARALIDDRFNLSNEAAAILQAAALFDPRAAQAMLDALPDDPEPEQGTAPGRPTTLTPRVKQTARLAVARVLALPPRARRREALRVPGQFDLWPAVLDD